jgi:hypothetical protein
MLGGMAAAAGAFPLRPKLLVLVVLEQFRPDYIDELWGQFSPGGFRKILGQGAYFPDCRHLASTFPASTLATLATGAWPAQHGIVADRWYDRGTRRLAGASGQELLATTLAAQVAAAPRTRVSVVATTPASAGLFAGTADARLYWMDAAGRFATAGDPPEWMSAFNEQKSPEAVHGARWVAVGAKPDAPPLRVLSFDAERPREFTALYKASPFGQAALFDFLGELVARERLGQGPGFDFVCLLAGSTELLGYETGARSPLMGQLALDLDSRLKTLVEQLGRAAGETGFDLVVAGCHGAPPLPRPEDRVRMAVNGETVAQAVEHGLGAGNRVERYLYPFVYLEGGSAGAPEAVRMAAGRAALNHPAVAGYCTAGGACSTRDEWERRFRNSFHPRRSGDVMLSYRPEYVEEYGGNRGISYGSLYNYDARVPLCFYGPQFRAGVFESSVESVDLAPTLARAMGIAPPSSAVGSVLGGVFAGTGAATP